MLFEGTGKPFFDEYAHGFSADCLINKSVA